MIKRLKLWAPVVLWCGVIFAVSGIPNLRIEALGAWDYILRKISHAAEYAILAMLLLRALEAEKKGSVPIFSVFWALFLTFVYAVSDEFHQYYVPGRYTAATDVLIDTIGGILGIIIYGKKIRNKS